MTKYIVTKSIPNETITLKSGENLTYIAILKDGWENHKTLTFELKGHNASLKLIAIILDHPNDTQPQTFPFTITTNHLTTNTKSDISVRSVLRGNSQVDFTGNIIIPKKAQQTTSNLSHDTLLLSDKAHVHTTPCLEIEADDVKAGHSATIGTTDDDTLFYLLSRGLDKEAAEELLIEGFIQADIDKIEDKKIKEDIIKELC